VLGIVLGIAVAILCHRFSLVKTILSPIISVIRSTPVASFIVLLWVMLDGNMLTITVAFLMVMPIVWQNTLDGFASIPKELVEVAQVYELSLKRRYEILVFPVLSRYIFPAIITSVGLAWKSEVAAEIIAYTKDSIGMHINDAKSLLLTESVFAWTIVIIVTSICLEMLLKKLLGRGNK
jgi:NitT/TauT family transport system permease protein